jgi:hypothetical protein
MTKSRHIRVKYPRTALAIAAAVLAAAIVSTTGAHASATRAATEPVPCTLDGTALACTLPAVAPVTTTSTVTATTTAPGATVTTTAPGTTVTVTAPAETTPPVEPAGPWSPQPIFQDTFDVAKPAGFATPANNDPLWTGYHYSLNQSAGHDTSKRGFYRAEQASIANGSMAVRVETIDGKPRVFSPIPKVAVAQGGQGNAWPHNGQLGGRYSVDVKISGAIPRYKQAFLLWPDSGNWNEGELDFPEGGYDSVDNSVTAFSHKVVNPNITSNCSSNTYRHSPSDTPVNTGSKWGADTWHTYVMEWVPSNGNTDDAQNPGRWSTFVDGALIHETTNPSCIPSKPMHWVLQIETAIGGAAPAAATAGTVSIDNVRIWDYVG